MKWLPGQMTLNFALTVADESVFCLRFAGGYFTAGQFYTITLLNGSNSPSSTVKGH